MYWAVHAWKGFITLLEPEDSVPENLLSVWKDKSKSEACKMVKNCQTLKNLLQN